MRNKAIKIGYISLTFLSLAATTLATGCLQGLSGQGSPAASPVSTITVTAVPPVTTVTVYSPPSVSSMQYQTSLPSLASVIAQVRPSVVAIDTQSNGIGFFGSSFTQQGAGSGWIIDKDGMIVTNNHVVEGASTINVTLEDGRSFPAKSVHTDPVADLAILQIDAQNLTALRLGDSSQLQDGDWVVAIGNSLGMGISVTKGIVSATGVSLAVSAGENLKGLIQTDAAINPGNSGGPLVNLAGEVVGINSAKVSQIGVEGMGYAISINEARPIIDQLITNGYIVRPYLGASFYTVDQYVTQRYRLGISQGVLLTDVASSSPADKAGLKAGDVITAFDDKAMNDQDTLMQAIDTSQVGQKVRIDYWRGRSQSTVYVTLTQSPPPSQ